MRRACGAGSAGKTPEAFCGREPRRREAVWLEAGRAERAPEPTENERAHNMTLLWREFDEAARLISKQKPKSAQQAYLIARDTAAVREFATRRDI